MITKYEVLSLLGECGFDQRKLQAAGELDRFINTLIGEFQQRESHISELEEKLRRREIRRMQRVTQREGRGRGRVALHPQGDEYAWAWAIKELNEKPPRIGRKPWLRGIAVDIDGENMSGARRAHIETLLSRYLSRTLPKRKKDLPRLFPVEVYVTGADE